MELALAALFKEHVDEHVQAAAQERAGAKRTQNERIADLQAQRKQRRDAEEPVASSRG